MPLAKILVVDDHVDTLEFLRTVLTHAGHDVTVAADGEDGLCCYRSDRPHVVILDIFMPRMDGMALMAALRADGPAAAKIIAMSAGWGMRGADVLREARDRGADRVFPKPLDVDALLAAVKELSASS